MSRRVVLPGASELFRPTGQTPEAPDDREPDRGPAHDGRRGRPAAEDPAGDTGPRGSGDAERPTGAGRRRPQASGRVRHEEKITVYVSADELLALEQLRLTLRAEHGVAADRGRIVRAAIAEALADVHDHGEDAALVRRLGQR